MEVNYNDMNKALNTLIKQAPGFDEKLVAYVDSCTINRPEGFDMHTWTYWGMRYSTDSVCASFAGIYGSYRTFRKLQEQLTTVQP